MERAKRRKSTPALFLLFAEGCCFLLISVAVLACAFALNFHEDFDYDIVKEQQDYSQYWVGVLLLITAFLSIAAGTLQKTRWVIITAMFLFLATILVSLFALVVEGNDWLRHKNDMRCKGFWDAEGYQCNSATSTSCSCTKGSDVKRISEKVDCDTLEKLDYVYGGLVCCVLVAVFLALSSIVVVLIFIPIRPFIIPMPNIRIRKITVLEDQEEPVVHYKTRPREPEPKAEVEEIVLRERKPRMRTVVEPQPLPEPRVEVEEVVVRERNPPRPHADVYAVPQKHVGHLPPPRRDTLIYDEPRPEAGQIHTLVPVEGEPGEEIVEMDEIEGKDYAVGRFMHTAHPTPPAPVLGKGFVVNPNFKKGPARVVKEEEPEPVHYGRPELEPVQYSRPELEPVQYSRPEIKTIQYARPEIKTVQYSRAKPQQVHYVRREQLKPQPARYARKPTIVYEERPRVSEHRALVPVRSGRPKGRMVAHSKHHRPRYIIERPGQRPLIAVRRPRANSDEGPRVVHARGMQRAQPRRIYTAQPVRAHARGERRSRMEWQRARSNSDEGARLYREHQTPGRVYTDREIAMAAGKEETLPGAKPRLFTGENIATANLGHKRATALVPQASNGKYDKDLEASLESADKWHERPKTPY